MSHQSSVARDGKRISDIKTLSESARITSAQLRLLPTPIADSVSLTVSGSFIGYQGFMSLALVNPLGYGSDKIFDPKDNIPYTYRVNQHYDQAQFLAYLENPRFERTIEIAKQSLPSTLPSNLSDTLFASDSFFASDSLLVSKAYAFDTAYALDSSSIDLSKRYPYSAGDRLGIFLSKGSKQPLQNGVSGTGSRDISLSDASTLDIIVGSQGADEYVSTDISTGSLNALKSGTFDEKALLGMNSGTGSNPSGSGSGNITNHSWTHKKYLGTFGSAGFIENDTVTYWGSPDLSFMDNATNILEIGGLCLLNNDHSTQCMMGASFGTPIEKLGDGYGICGIQSDMSVLCLPLAPELADIPNNLNETIAVSSSDSHVCALSASGGVTCWGNNAYGQIDVPVGLSNVIEISVAVGSSCALKSDTSIVCWGVINDDSNINLLTGVTHISSSILGFSLLHNDGSLDTIRVIGIPGGRISNNVATNVTDISGSCYKTQTNEIKCLSTHTPSELQNVQHAYNRDCYLTTSNVLLCNNIFVFMPSYQSPSGMTQVQSFVQNDNTGDWCALKTDQTVVCSSMSSWATPPSGLTDVVQLSTSHHNFCALKSDDSLICWGERDVVPAGAQTGVIDIAGTGFANCALKSDNSLICWGPDTGNYYLAPDTLTGVVDVTMGGNQFCARLLDSSTICREYTNAGQNSDLTPSGSDTFSQISVQYTFACGIKVDGGVSCWNNASYTGPSLTPPSIFSSGVTDISTQNGGGVCVVKNGKVGCWGNYYRKYPE